MVNVLWKHDVNQCGDFVDFVHIHVWLILATWDEQLDRYCDKQLDSRAHRIRSVTCFEPEHLRLRSLLQPHPILHLLQLGSNRPSTEQDILVVWACVFF